jgi:hypothetical protein
MTVCEEKAIQLIQNIDKNIIKTYKNMLLYRESFHLSDYLLPTNGRNITTKDV